MGHGIRTSKLTGLAEMAFSGETPWHKLGQQVRRGAPTREWQVQSGLLWTAEEGTAHYYNKDGLLLPMSSRKVIYRSDTSDHIGMVSSDYKCHQPEEILDTFRAAMPPEEGWEIETCGALHGGSKIWAMATSHIQGMIKKHDKIRGNLLVATSMDGSMKTIVKFMNVRVVCANTMALALAAVGNGEVELSHRSYFDIDEIKSSLGLAQTSFAEFMVHAEELAETPIDLTEARELLRVLFGKPKSKVVRAEDAFKTMMAQFNPDQDGTMQREQRSVDRCMTLFAGQGIGSQLEGSVGTRWGILNAITQHTDHEMGRSDSGRMESAWFGRGDEIKRKAYAMLCEADLAV